MKSIEELYLTWNTRDLAQRVDLKNQTRSLIPTIDVESILLKWQKNHYFSGRHVEKFNLRLCEKFEKRLLIRM